MDGSSSTRGARLFWGGALVLLALAVVFTVQHSLVTEEASTQPGAPACRDVDIPDPPAEAVRCRTRTATITIAGEDHPVVLDRTEARVLRSRLDRRLLTVTVRLRNEAETTPRSTSGRRQLYLRIGDDRFWPRPFARSEVTLELRFTLPRRTARLLRRDRVTADLGVIDWGELGAEQPARTGAIRLDPRS